MTVERVVTAATLASDTLIAVEKVCVAIKCLTMNMIMNVNAKFLSLMPRVCDYGGRGCPGGIPSRGLLQLSQTAHG